MRRNARQLAGRSVASYTLEPLATRCGAAFAFSSRQRATRLPTIIHVRAAEPSDTTGYGRPPRRLGRGGELPTDVATAARIAVVLRRCGTASPGRADGELAPPQPAQLGAGLVRTH